VTLNLERSSYPWIVLDSMTSDMHAYIVQVVYNKLGKLLL